MCDFLTLHPYYIYHHYPQMQEWLFREKNPKRGFYNTPTYQRELPILREKSLQSFLIPSPIVIPIGRRFLLKHYPHTFKVLRVLLVLLGSIGRCQGWRMQRGACCEIRRAKQDMVPRILVGVGVWRAQIHRVDQAQRVSY